MIEFSRVISSSEIRCGYLNLTDERGQTFGQYFPDHRTRLVVIDGQKRMTFAQQHHTNQIWGTLRNWYRDNRVRPGDRVLVKHNASERCDGYSVLRLIPE